MDLSLSSRFQEKLELLQHGRRDQLLFDMPLNALGKKAAKVGGALARPRTRSKSVHRRAKHLRSQCARLGSDLAAGKAFVAGAEQAVGQGMEPRAAAVQRCSAHHA